MRTGHQNKFNNNNRPQQQNRNGNRNRGAQGGGGKGNSLNRAYESNGPGIKLRGTAHHIAERYVTLARDAQSAGDTIAYEGYMQHAEHYLRLIAANNEILKANNPNFRPAPLPGTIIEDYDDEEGDGEQNENGHEEDHAQADQPLVQQHRPQHQNQPRRRFDHSNEAQPEQGERPQQERPQGERQHEGRRERFNRERFNRDGQPNPQQNNGQNGETRRERRPYPPQVQQERVQQTEQPMVENFGLPAFLTAPPMPVKPEAVSQPVTMHDDDAPPPRRRGRPKFEPKDPATVPVE